MCIVITCKCLCSYVNKEWFGEKTHAMNFFLSFLGYSWIRQRGSTGSSGTGPSSDHTRRNRLGYYIYIETSSVSANKTARLLSPTVTLSGSQCLSFWYHMYGSDINRLSVRFVTLFPVLNSIALHWLCCGSFTGWISHNLTKSWGFVVSMILFGFGISTPFLDGHFTLVIN